MIIKKFLIIQDTTGKRKDIRMRYIREQAQPTLRVCTFKLYNLTYDLFTRKHRQFGKGRYPDL